MQTVNIKYKFEAGWHVFESDELPGLYVASTDWKAAYDDVKQSIKKLLKLNAGLNT